MYLMLAATYLWDLYGSSIAFVIHSLVHSLSTRLIPAGAFKGWCAVRTLQMYFSNRFLSIRKCEQNVNPPPFFGEIG